MSNINFLVCLVGEQPAPNLLSIRQFGPQSVLLVHSSKTAKISSNLKSMLSNVIVKECPITNPFDIIESVEQMSRALIDLKVADDSGLAFNVTGGTKPMSQAAYIIAQRVRAPIVYLQSEGPESKFYFYRFDNSLKGLASSTFDGLSTPSIEPLSKFLSIDDYLQIHGISKPKYQRASNTFENEVSRVLQAQFCEVRRSVRVSDALEIDMIVRCRNRYAVAELKTGSASRKKAPIDQLIGATSREFLGTYTNRILILDQPLSSENAKLAKAYQISTIVLDGYDSRSKAWKIGKMPRNQSEKLIASFTKILGKP